MLVRFVGFFRVIAYGTSDLGLVISHRVKEVSKSKTQNQRSLLFNRGNHGSVYSTTNGGTNVNKISQTRRVVLNLSKLLTLENLHFLLNKFKKHHSRTRILESGYRWPFFFQFAIFSVKHKPTDFQPKR